MTGLFKMRTAPPSVLKLVNVTGYDPFLEAFITKEGYLDIFGIRTKNMQALTRNEADYEILLWQKFYQCFEGDLKIVSVICPVDLKPQRDLMKERLNKTDNPAVKKVIREKINELDRISEGYAERDFYMMLFSETEKEMRDSVSKAQALLPGSLIKLDRKRKQSVLKLLYNQSAVIRGGLS